MHSHCSPCLRGDKRAENHFTTEIRRTRRTPWDVKLGHYREACCVLLTVCCMLGFETTNQIRGKTVVPRASCNQQQPNNPSAKARLATNSSGRSNESEQCPEVD